mmetsp:Transcript_13043/g.27473  ORF Transcript_13043/g.27473 Transcript_13043/m.27473 type:complete len:82 (+) Transcript_13043:1075-1320(+)
MFRIERPQLPPAIGSLAQPHWRRRGDSSGPLFFSNASANAIQNNYFHHTFHNGNDDGDDNTNRVPLLGRLRRVVGRLQRPI